MIKSSLVCSKCGGALQPAQILAAGPFPCPNCQTILQAAKTYGRWIGAGSLILSVAASLLLGFKGLHLLYSILVLLAVIDYLALHLLKYAVPPKIELAVSPTPFREVVREIMGPTELNLRNKKRP
jgi:hypothetical protein